MKIRLYNTELVAKVLEDYLVSGERSMELIDVFSNEELKDISALEELLQILKGDDLND